MNYSCCEIVPRVKHFYAQAGVVGSVDWVFLTGLAVNGQIRDTGQNILQSV